MSPADDAAGPGEAPAPLADLDAILASLSVRRREGVFAVCTVDEVPDADVEAVVVEDEGLTVVLPLDQAQDLRLSWGFEAAWLTVEVRTALDGVGLTAAFSAALAAADLSGLDAHVLFAAERGVPVELLRDNRGWSEADWESSVEGLAGRGLITSDGLSADGRALSGSGAALRISDPHDRAQTQIQARIGRRIFSPAAETHDHPFHGFTLGFRIAVNQFDNGNRR